MRGEVEGDGAVLRPLDVEGLVPGEVHVLRYVRGSLQQLHRPYPVEAEDPLVGHLVTPADQVPAAPGEEQGPGVDVPLGRLVPRVRVVDEVEAMPGQETFPDCRQLPRPLELDADPGQDIGAERLLQRLDGTVEGLVPGTGRRQRPSARVRGLTDVHIVCHVNSGEWWDQLG